MRAIDLDGRAAIVTGGGQGLGRAIAAALHGAGAQVAVTWLDDGSEHHRTRAEAVVRELGAGAVAVPADVRDVAAVSRLFDETVDHFGGVDVVVNNAGINRDRTTAKMSDDEWRAVIDTNLTGVFNVSREAARRLRDGGRIVSLASIAAVLGAFGQVNYAAAKSGVTGLTRVLSRELARRRITVNAVAPGVVLTEMGRTIPDDVLARMQEQVPLGRFGEPEEIADVVLFLCSDLASYVTGQTVHVNGGWWG